jgi:hypothetical protein
MVLFVVNGKGPGAHIHEWGDRGTRVDTARHGNSTLALPLLSIGCTALNSSTILARRRTLIEHSITILILNLKLPRCSSGWRPNPIFLRSIGRTWTRQNQIPFPFCIAMRLMNALGYIICNAQTPDMSTIVGLQRSPSASFSCSTTSLECCELFPQVEPKVLAIGHTGRCHVSVHASISRLARHTFGGPRRRRRATTCRE